MFKFSLEAETPEKASLWRPILEAILQVIGGTKVAALPAPAAVADVTTKSGKLVENASSNELTKDLKEAGHGAFLLSLPLPSLRNFYRAHVAGDEATMAKIRGAVAPPTAVDEEPPKAKAPAPAAKTAAAAPVAPAKAIPQPPGAPAKPVAAPAKPVPTKGKAKAPVAEDEVAEAAPVAPRKAAKPAADEPKVIARAPLPAKKAPANTLGRVTPDSIPGGNDPDPDDDDPEVVDEESEIDETFEEEPEEGAEDEVEEEPEEEPEEEEAPPVVVPTIKKAKIPTELLAADRMRNIIAIIQRTHNVSAPKDIYGYMLAYAAYIPKIQQHIDAEGTEERMTARITNIVAAMAPGR